jgi:hypothetical protein
MSPLGQAVYQILRRRTSLPESRITYAELAAQLRDTSEDFAHINHRSQLLYGALNEVGEKCRLLKLPLLPALVVRSDTRRPGAAYFAGKCTGTTYQGDPVATWWREVEAVRATTYPRR